MDAVAGTGLLADRYQLHEVIGRGGMADVHRATDRVLDRQVAVKLLRESAESDTDRARFTGEARTLAGLTHGGLVTVLDAGISVERPFLVMELVDGPTLSAALAAGPLDPDRAAQIGRRIAEAIAYAHSRGVVHRDVKPGNILLGRDGPRLADFGIARLIGDTVHHTRTGQAIGTAAYLAPEQVAGGGVSGAVDVYSLGLVLLECLTGQRAFPGPPTEAALQRLSRDPAIPAHLPAPWVPLLTAMTARDPAERPSAAQVAEVLRTGEYAAVPTPPLTTVVAPSRTGLRERLAGLPAEHRIALLALSGVAAVVLLAGMVLSLGAGGSPAPPAQVPVPTAAAATTPGAVSSPAPRQKAGSQPAPVAVADGDDGTGGGSGGDGQGSGDDAAKAAEKATEKATDRVQKAAEKAASRAEKAAEKAVSHPGNAAGKASEKAAERAAGHTADKGKKGR